MILVLLEKTVAFEEGKCAGQCIWMLLGIEIAEVS